MIKRYLAVSDLDGTLLSSDKKLSGESVVTFRRLSHSDIATAILTTRPERLAKDFARSLLCDAVAYNNGAEIYVRGELIFTSCLSDVFVREFTKRLVERFPDLPIGAEADGELYANYNLCNLWKDDECVRCDFPRFPFSKASKLLIVSERDTDLALISSFALDYDIHLEKDGNTIIITAPKATKENALKLITKTLGIDLCDVFGFGNDLGDLEFLKLCGHPYCVANGNKTLKSYAVLIGSNDENGVAETITKTLMGEK